VTSCAIHIVHVEEMKSVGFLIWPQNPGDDLSVVWPQNHCDDFLVWASKSRPTI
jgi:hypothetical protein